MEPVIITIGKEPEHHKPREWLPCILEAIDIPYVRRIEALCGTTIHGVIFHQAVFTFNGAYWGGKFCLEFAEGTPLKHFKKAIGIG